jgi:hypothetical protein
VTVRKNALLVSNSQAHQAWALQAQPGLALASFASCPRSLSPRAARVLSSSLSSYRSPPREQTYLAKVGSSSSKQWNQKSSHHALDRHHIKPSRKHNCHIRLRVRATPEDRPPRRRRCRRLRPDQHLLMVLLPLHPEPFQSLSAIKSVILKKQGLWIIHFGTT